MSAQVLSFKSKKSVKKNFDRYLVIKIKMEPESDQRFLISPEIMHWRDDLWIIDLKATERYWYAVGLQKNLSLEAILRKQLEKISKEYIWVNCKHPWQGLKLIPLLNPSKELRFFDEDYCKNLMKALSWEDWLEDTDTLYNYLIHFSGKTKLDKFKSKAAQLLRAMDRLGLECVYDIEQADTSSMQKRFGYYMGKLWEWTFPNKRSDLPLLQGLQDLNEFPWECEKPKELPKKLRALDYSVDSWDQLEPFLQEDIAHLEKYFLRQKRISVCKLQWSLQLYGGKEFRLDIDFRNPYKIFEDAPVFQTALTQAKFQFEAWQKDLKEEKLFHDYLEAYKVVSWRLEVSKSLHQGHTDQELKSFSKSSTNYLRILELENKLPKAVENFRLKKSFQLDNHEIQQKTAGLFSQNDNLWTKTGSHRPLYYRDTQKKLNSLPYRSFFLERNSSDWWKEDHSKDYNWDFYKSHYDRGWNWVVRNSFGDIYELGRFD